MVEEGRLPTSELIFHFTHYELGVLLHGPNPALMHKYVCASISTTKFSVMFVLNLSNFVIFRID